MPTLTLSAVSDAIYALLNQSSVTSLTSGPASTEVPQGTNFPYCWFTVTEENDRGFGAGTLNRHFLRVHAVSVGTSTMGPAKQLQGILDAATALLKDATLTVTGFRAAGQIFYDSTTDPIPSEIGGQACHEAVSTFYFWIEP